MVLASLLQLLAVLQASMQTQARYSMDVQLQAVHATAC